jgi:outer membrane immunogenic protein
MKRIVIVGAFLLSVGGPALAADLPPPPAPMPRAPATYIPVVAVYNWTGFYLGGNLGFAFNHGSFSDPLGNTFGVENNTKFLGGGQIGYNYEFGNGFLIGAEAMFDWS